MYVFGVSAGAILPVKTKPEGDSAHLLSYCLEAKKSFKFVFRITSTPFDTWNLIQGQSFLSLTIRREFYINIHP
jgi:hypothetical protein